MKQMVISIKVLSGLLIALATSVPVCKAQSSDILGKQAQSEIGGSISTAVIATYLRGACEANKVLLSCPELTFLGKIFPGEFPACLEPASALPPACVNHYYCAGGTIGMVSICQYSRCENKCQLNPGTMKYEWFVRAGVLVTSVGLEPRLVGTSVPECGNFFICEPSGQEECNKDSVDKVNLGFCIDPLRKKAQNAEPKKDEPMR